MIIRTLGRKLVTLFAVSLTPGLSAITLNDFFVGHYHLHGDWKSENGDHGHWHGWMNLDRSQENGQTFYEGHWSLHIDDVHERFENRSVTLKFQPINTYEAKVLDSSGSVVGQARCGENTCTYTAVDRVGSFKETYRFKGDKVSVSGSMSTAGNDYSWNGHGHRE